MRSRIFDNLITTRMDLRFVSKKRLKSFVSNGKYQIVEIVWDHQYKENHILFSTHMTPTNFKYYYKEKLQKDKKIILYGNWRSMVRFYRLLDFNKYHVYLVK